MPNKGYVDGLGVSEAEFDLLLDDIEKEHEKNAEKRFERYAEDLREVLHLSSGAGIRVIRHWIDATGMNAQTFQPNSNIYKNAALADFGKSMFSEIAAVDPKSYLRISLEGALETQRDKEK